MKPIKDQKREFSDVGCIYSGLYPFDLAQDRMEDHLCGLKMFSCFFDRLGL